MDNGYMPSCRNCGQYVYLGCVEGIVGDWRHWTTKAICCDDTETIFADPVKGDNRIYGPIVQCKVTAATVNYPCNQYCDRACEPGSEEVITADMEWRYVGTLEPITRWEDCV